jgi:poly(U)-specific endoribonuclease
MATKKKKKKEKKKKKKPSPGGGGGGGGSDIYQRIWDADQAYAGLRAVKFGESTAGLKDHGYIVVDEPDGNGEEQFGRDHILIREVHIPKKKKASYDRVATLFNNYELDQTKEDDIAPEEAEEVQDFIQRIYKTPPLQIARDYIEDRQGGEMDDDVWWNIIQRCWFEQFDDGVNRDLSGFEHVVVGEQKQGKVQGYHFWYKYFLDENFVFGDVRKDLIQFLGFKGSKKDSTPEVATISYVWEAFDYRTGKTRKLTKPTGGFWIGPSIEGLLALGTVRFVPDAMAPKEAVINRTKYELKLFRSANDRHMRTFYPVFVDNA